MFSVSSTSAWRNESVFGIAPSLLGVDYSARPHASRVTLEMRDGRLRNEREVFGDRRHARNIGDSARAPILLCASDNNTVSFSFRNTVTSVLRLPCWIHPAVLVSFSQCPEQWLLVGELHSKAIELDRQALKLRTSSHPLRAECLRYLSHHLYRRFDELGGSEYINESINIAREELSLYPPGHSERSSSLTNLAVCLATRHRKFSDVGDLSEAIFLDREAFSLFPPGHSDRSMPLNNLAVRLFTQYGEYGTVEDLSESISLSREVLFLRPPGRPPRSISLNNLAICLSTRYERHGAVENLTEAINLNREALSLCPPGHLARSYTLNSLASLFSYRHRLHDDAVEDLSEAINLHREALSFRPLGHPLRSASLVNLANELSTRKGGKSFSNLFISSYTPILSALVRARRPTCSPSAELKSFVAIGQANAAGTSQLHTVGAELADIGECLSGHSTFVCIEGEDSCISRVTEELGKNAWVQLACHGTPNPEQPFDSAFALYDGQLTIRDISQTNVQNAEFTYLSACHTMVGDKESPDEAIHLAGAMQFAGSWSVIGTMRAVDDGQANKVISVFYKSMLCGGLDHTQATCVLWKTMRTVKGVTL